jgi:hypothetical protein
MMAGSKQRDDSVLPPKGNLRPNGLSQLTVFLLDYHG